MAHTKTLFSRERQWHKRFWKKINNQGVKGKYGKQKTSD